MKLLAWVFILLAAGFALLATQPGVCPTGCDWLQWPWDLGKCYAYVYLCPILGQLGYWVPLSISMVFFALAWIKR